MNLSGVQNDTESYLHALTDENDEDSYDTGYHTFQGTIDTGQLFKYDPEKSQTTCEFKGDIPTYVNGQCPLRWQVKGELARGTQAVIFKGKDVQTNELSAIRVAFIGSEDMKTKSETFQQFHNDITIRLKLCQCPAFRMPLIKDFFFCNVYGVLVTELAEGNMLDWVLETDLPDISVMINTLQGIIHAMHQCGVIHRDLHYGNVLFQTVNQRPEWMLTDFESATFKDNLSDRMLEAYISDDNRSMKSIFYEMNTVSRFWKARKSQNEKLAQDLWEGLDAFVKGDLISRDSSLENYNV